MFDFKSETVKQPRKEKGHSSLVIFNQTEEFKNLVEESCRFGNIYYEGSHRYGKKEIINYAHTYKRSIIIFELSNCPDIEMEVNTFVDYLPIGSIVIIAGSDNSISTQRELFSRGFYYLYYPIGKFGFVDYIKNILNNPSQLSAKRKAKRVVVMGSKGGVGTSFITSEVSKELSRTRSCSCLLVDNKPKSGNIDIMLGLKRFQKKVIDSTLNLTDIEDRHAVDLKFDVEKGLSLLSVSPGTLSEVEYQEYKTVLVDKLKKGFNFVVEDYSGSSSDCLDNISKKEDIDIFILIVERTMSSLRESTRILNHLRAEKYLGRIVVVVNNTKPYKYMPIEVKDIETGLGTSVNVCLSFEPKLNQIILAREDVFSKSLPLSKDINFLTRLILGEIVDNSKLSLLDRLTKRFSG
jgi:pilus assembly protein CpaE